MPAPGQRFYEEGCFGRYREISLEDDPRRAQFAYFSTLANPYVGLTAEVDVGDFLARCHAIGWPFSLAMTYCAGLAANAIPALRRRIRNGGVVEFDHCRTSHTVLREDGVYAYCTLDPAQPFAQFLPEARRLQEAAREHGTLDDGEEPLDLLFLSSIPWLHYTALTQPTPIPADSNPRITWGKYATEGGKTTLPVTLLVNHALADGLHIAHFFAALREALEQL